MPRFVNASETREIQAPWWGEKETCAIRRFNYGDRQWLAEQSVAVGIKTDQGEKGTVADVLVGKMNLAILERGIVRWTDADGEVLPVTRDAIGRLEELDADFILGEINELSPRRSRDKEAQATFRGEPGDRASTE